MIGRGEAIELVVGHLRHAILSGQLEPGERVVQHTVAEQLGVSRSPVREALRALKAEGLVSLETKFGARVVRLDLNQLLEVYWLREHIEPAAVAASVPLFSALELDAISAMPQAMEECWRAGDALRWHELDRLFHFALLQRTPMPQVRALAASLWNQAAPYMRAYVQSAPERAAEVGHLEHRLLADAVVRRCAEDAQQFLEVHIRRTRLALSLQPELLYTPSDRLTRSPGSGKDDHVLG